MPASFMRGWETRICLPTGGETASSSMASRRGWTFLAFSKKIRLPGQKGRLRTDYLFTRDMAKELAMVEQTEGGRLTSRPLQLTFEWQ